FMASHPIVVHRIADLERSGLPGAPTHWHAVEVEEAADDPQVRKARRRFAGEFVVRFAGPLALIGAVLAYVVKDYAVMGWCLLAGPVRVAEGRSLRRAGGPGPRMVPPLTDAGRRTPRHLGRRRDPHALLAVGLRLPPRPGYGTDRSGRCGDQPQRPLA